MANKTDYSQLYKKKRETTTDKVLAGLEREAEERELRQIGQIAETAKSIPVEEAPALPEQTHEPVSQKIEDQPSSEQVALPPNKGGRPRKYNEPMKWIKIQLTESNYSFLKRYGGEFDGMNGYINHLVDAEREKNMR